MKKRIISAILATAMCLALAACGGNGSTGGGNAGGGNAGNTSGGNTGGGGAAETDWPSKQAVTVVLPYSAGGDTDTYCRQMCKQLTEELGQNFVAVNTTGGAGVVASSSVLTAPNDGYTLLFHHTGTMLTQEAAGSNEFSFLDDFEVVATVAKDETYALICRADSPWQTAGDMVSWAKEHPGELRYSITYFGATHAVAEAMQRTMGIEMNNIDVGSDTAERLVAFMADQCDVLVVNFMNIADYVENGDFRVLGICAEERLPGLEEFPTLKEQGYEVLQPKQYEVRAPKGTDPAIIAKLSAAIEKVASSDEFSAILETYYARSFYRDGATTIAEDSAMVEEMKEYFAE